MSLRTQAHHQESGITELNERVANLAMDSLGLPKSTKLRNEPFRTLGVDSLDKLKLAIDLERSFDVAIADKDIAAAKTIEQAVKLVEHAVKVEHADAEAR